MKRIMRSIKKSDPPFFHKVLKFFDVGISFRKLMTIPQFEFIPVSRVMSKPVSKIGAWGSIL
ncbi:hypothetical protein AD933_01735 [Acetobacter malorum]|uniref:Uncharacterized protein n=2 Tax=Acetobacter TaxID=434 RepID=A0A149RYF8_9PROT|nr:hypothetical protein AD933_01735 [Acetobacter malorum]KXV70050.1 hypothetical protein AD952_13795 [Acetobacter cerevisiae]KXV71673.1 hypothetical protein AD951_01505 [Acetobacter malorum]KXV75038.1 hypothetical protein AD953_09130 [Acetobacter malorum]